MSRSARRPSLIQAVKPYAVPFAAGLVCLTVSKLLLLEVPPILGKATDALLAQESNVVPSLAAALVGVAIIAAITRVLSRLLIFDSARYVERDLRRKIFAKLTGLSSDVYRRIPIGDLLSRLMSDVSRVRFMVGPALLNLSNTGLVYVVVLPAMLATDRELTVVCLAPLLLLAVVGKLFSKTMYGIHREVQEAVGLLSSRVQQNLAGAMSIRVYGRAPTETKQFAADSENVLRAHMRHVRVSGVLDPMLGLIGASTTVLLLWLGGQRIIAGTLTVGEFVQLSGYLGFLVWPTIALGSFVSTWQSASSALDRMGEILTATETFAEGTLVHSGAAKLEVRNLELTHPGADTPTLRGISATFEPGQCVLITGPIGSGKSTLLSVLARQVEVPEGALFIDGRDVRALTLESITKVIAYAPQDAFLFSRSVFDNVAFGHADPSEADVLGAVADAELGRDIEQLPEGLATIVGERGVTLSGGQRQRTALARALISRAPILLLDDPLAAVDTETESKILDMLEHRSGTTIIVSHRLSVARIADRVIVLDDGRIIEDGSPNELMLADGVFARLSRMQRGAEEADRPAEAPNPTASAPARSHDRTKTEHATELRPILDRALLGRLVPFILPHKRLFAAGLAMYPIVALLHLLQPYLIKVAIDTYIIPGVAQGFGLIVVAYVAVVALELAVRFVRNYLTQLVGQRAVHDLRSTLFERIQELDIGEIERTAAGKYLTVVLDDVEALRGTFSTGVVSIVGDLVTLAGIAAMMLILDWRLTLISFSVVPVIVWLIVRARPLLREAWRDVRAEGAEVNSFVNETLNGMAVVQSFGRQSRFITRMHMLTDVYRAKVMVAVSHDALLFAVMEGVGIVSLALLLFFGNQDFASGAIQIGVLVAFVDYLRRFFGPLTQLTSRFSTMQSAMAAAERCIDLLDRSGTVTPPTQAKPMLEGGLSVRFDGVDFGYEPGHLALHGLDLEVKAGEKVAIVGPTGGGKSTIVKLIARLYDPQRGRIEIAGRNIKDIDPSELRRRIAIVLQEPHLVEGSVRDNIIFGRELDDDAAERAVDRSRADILRARLPGGLDFEVGVGGHRLSSGERQLIAFARAMAANPDLLVLDEATSAVDPQTEARLREGLEALYSGRTAIIIAHRLSTIRDADRIVVIADGRIVEQGSHQTLLERRGRYFELHQHSLATSLSAS